MENPFSRLLNFWTQMTQMIKILNIYIKPVQEVGRKKEK